MKIPTFLFAPLIVAFFLGAIAIGNTWELPSVQQEFSADSGQTQKTELIIQGLRCRGTANFLMKRLQGIPGIVSVATYVQEHRATIEYDPALISEEKIIAEIEKPVQMQNGQAVKPFTVTETLK